MSSGGSAWNKAIDDLAWLPNLILPSIVDLAVGVELAVNRTSGCILCRALEVEHGVPKLRA
jgi:hypothetical protein